MFKPSKPHKIHTRKQFETHQYGINMDSFSNCFRETFETTIKNQLSEETITIPLTTEATITTLPDNK